VRCFSLVEQLELTLELLNERQQSMPQLPSKLIPAGPRRSQ
jgi:hypothetical protein